MPPSTAALLARTYRRALRRARSLRLRRRRPEARSPIGWRCRGRTAPGCPRRGTRGEASGHNATRLVTAARRGAEDRAVDVWMAKPNGEGQLPTRRDAEHRRAFSGHPDSETRSHPSTHVLDEERLVCREPLRLKAGEYSWSRSVSSDSRWTPTIIVDATSAASRDVPHCEPR